ncbi:MAG: DUF4281 domain-containing protein [Tabrizicola sp.]|nr:DUF4281 domain-containing protein [Tabrizicola sp.]
MLADHLFQLANPLVLLGWVALALSPFAPRAAQSVAMTIPLVLSVLYTGLVLAFWWEAPGSFATLADVQSLFTHPQIALAGWLHYLAFDLVLGAWEVRTAHNERIAHWLVLPCLALTFLFGPAGFLAFAVLRLALARRVLP